MRIHYTTGGWHGGYAEFFAKALRSLGHEVFYFDDFSYGGGVRRLLKKLLVRIPRMEYRVDDYFRNVAGHDWLKSVRSFGPDLIILEYAPNVLPEYIREAKKSGTKVFYWMDAPAAGVQAKDALAGAAEADKVFSVDKAWMTTLYAPEDFIYLPIGGDQDIFHPIKDSKKEYDIVWVGSLAPQTGDGFLRAKILAGLPDKYRIALFGSGIEYWTKHFPVLKKYLKAGGVLPASELNEIYNKSEMVLNIHAVDNITALSGRTYEIALSGAFQLVDWRADLDTLYPENGFVSFQYAKNINGLVNEWMKKPEERAKRAESIRRYTLNHHTWKHRAEEMLKHFSG